ncbi:CdaR family transcriptional regulator [Conexibacter sp. SYSU D00693]|uniref:PucR family transcriptional regulator n=1 Tax=Conexibacter sp. SYSU D00693 TaxID=2812560 RepID=UPI00196BA058|nr:helix-turn-helix domain-containing protein [Conexibacter sp. SYSU D00693]
MTTGLASTSPDTRMRRAIQGVAEDLMPSLDEAAVAMAVAIHDGIDELGGELHAETVHSCRANIGLVCMLMLEGADPRGATPPHEAIHYAREFVRRGLPIEALMRAYRIGHQVFWQRFLDALGTRFASHDELAEAVAFCSDWTFAYVDTVSAVISAAYVEERERWARSAAAMRADEVRAVLDGRQNDEAEASRRLRYELGRRHVGLVVWGEAPDDPDATMVVFERVAQEVARVAGGTDTLFVPLGSNVLGAWIGLREDPDLTAVAQLRPVAAGGAKVRVAVGEPSAGLEGFRRTHQEAQRARDVATLLRRQPGGCVRFSDVALNALLSADLDEARRFVARELGDLAAETDASRRLAATLKVFLEEGASFVRAARRLGVHENTIAYRVKRAGELLGHGLEERQLEVRVALQLADVLRRAGDES